jgi:Ca2+-binding RTX toxin-like protein
MITAFLLPALAAVGAGAFSFVTETPEEENVEATSSKDTPEGNPVSGTTVEDFMFGTDDTDAFSGGEGHDEIAGGKGADTLWGGDGEDYIHGGNGSDDIAGERGHDVLVGGNGSDDIAGGKGNDKLHGGLDDDTLVGNQGVDELNGDAGNDYLNGGSGKDILNGGKGNDTLYGGAGKDALYGGSGDDILEDGVGNNVLSGGSGDDWLIGTLRTDGEEDVTEVAKHTGADLMIGGDGADTLVGDNGDSMSGGLGDDDFWVNQMEAIRGETEQTFEPVTIQDFDLSESILLRDAAGVELTSDEVVNGLVISSAGDDDADTMLSYNGQNTVLLRGVDAEELAEDLGWLMNLNVSQPEATDTSVAA